MPVIAPPTVPENTVSRPRLAPRLTPDSKAAAALGHQMARAHHRAVTRRAGDPEAPQPSLADPDRVMQADRVRHAALVVLRRDDPDLAGEFAGDLLEHRQTRRVDAVVVGDQNAIQHYTAPSSRRIRAEPMSVPEKSFEPEAACPLDGVRVIDMSRLVAGNVVSLQLADFGAEVIKIEDPKPATRCAPGRRTASASIGRSTRATRRAWR